MIRYRKELLRDQVWHKMVLHRNIMRARVFCERELDPDSWSMWRVGDPFGSYCYAVILIKNEDDANLFAMTVGDAKGFRGRIKFVYNDLHQRYDTIKL